MSTVVIDGRVIKTSGRSVSIVGNRVYIDDVQISDGEVKEPVKLIIEGDAMNVSTEGEVEVHGSVLGTIEAGGGVKCGHVGESIKAGGSIKCGNVGGDVKANGSVTCEDVKGSVKANGSVNYRR
jgi:hypothetical protein